MWSEKRRGVVRLGRMVHLGKNGFVNREKEGGVAVKRKGWGSEEERVGQ